VRVCTVHVCRRQSITCEVGLGAVLHDFADGVVTEELHVGIVLGLPVEEEGIEGALSIWNRSGGSGRCVRSKSATVRGHSASGMMLNITHLRVPMHRNNMMPRMSFRLLRWCLLHRLVWRLPSLLPPLTFCA
jgi:hypothetical protein